MPEIIGIQRIASQSVLSRFFGGFDSPGKNQRCFGALMQWCISRLKARTGGYSLDFDSTRPLHEDGHQEGVATEAALSLAVISYNLVVLFEQKLGWQEKRVSVGTLRYWLFVTAGVLGNHAGKSTLKLALPASQRPWWERLWAKLASPYPNCNAVGPAPPFACV